MATGTNAIATRTNANSKKSGAYTSELNRCITHNSAFSAGFTKFVKTQTGTAQTLTYNISHSINPTPGLSVTSNGKKLTLCTINNTCTYGNVSATSINVSVDFTNSGQITLSSSTVTVCAVIRVFDSSNNIISSESGSVRLQSGTLSANQTVTKTSTILLPSFSFESANSANRIELCVYNGMAPGDVAGSAYWIVTASTSTVGSISYFEGKRLVKYSNL